MYYTNSISPNTWITGFTDNNGDGKIVSWQTNDEANVAQYTVTIDVTNGCSSDQLSYTLDVRTACEIYVHTIDLSDTIFTSPALT